MKNKYIIQEIIMEARSADGSVFKKRVKVNGKERILADEWEDIEDGSSNN